MPESGWITFSAEVEDGVTVAQVQSIARANDPLYELGFLLRFAHRDQEHFWTHTLRALAAHCGVAAGQPSGSSASIALAMVAGPQPLAQRRHPHGHLRHPDAAALGARPEPAALGAANVPGAIMAFDIG